MRMILGAVTVLALMQPAVTPVQAQANADTATAHDLLITDVLIPLRDGVQLNARLYRPLGAAAPGPAVFSLTPYTSDDAHERGRFFAQHGYVYVNVNTRGRGGSGGGFWPLEQDGPDGYDIVAWIASQEWCDGRVAMRGGSYRGMVQWQTLKQGPEALATVVPTASVHPGWDYPNPGGIFLSYAARWLAFVNGAASQSSLFGDEDYWRGKYLEMYREYRPFADLDRLTGLPPRVFQRWIEHPYYDRFWQDMNPGPQDYARFDLPILTITGHFDGDQPGAMKYYSDHMRYGSQSGTAKHYLVLGPWSHAGTRDPAKELGGLTFGDNSVLDMEQLHLDWLNWVFKAGDRPEILQDRVAYYVMEANEWKYARSLEAVAPDTQTWYLTSREGEANDVFRSGTLSLERPTAAGTDSYAYDPLVTIEAYQELAALNSGYVGAGAAFAPYPKLVYHSAPLEADLEVSGYAQVVAYIELNVPDTDMLAFLYEVRADGRTVYLGDSELRARHRLGVDRVVLAEPGDIELYKFDRFYWFSRRLLEGSRLRLVIMPLNTPDRDKNYNSGGNTIYETDADARTAVVRLHHGAQYPSAVMLPVSQRVGG
jgi:putative CocE/NonD family hydrolase